MVAVMTRYRNPRRLARPDMLVHGGTFSEIPDRPFTRGQSAAVTGAAIVIALLIIGAALGWV